MPFSFKGLFIATRRSYEFDLNNGEFCFIVYNFGVGDDIF